MKQHLKYKNLFTVFALRIFHRSKLLINRTISARAFPIAATLVIWPLVYNIGARLIYGPEHPLNNHKYVGTFIQHRK